MRNVPAHDRGRRRYTCAMDRGTRGQLGCDWCGYDLSGLPAESGERVCPECGRSGPNPGRSALRERALLLGIGLAVTHNFIVIGAGHGAAPIGQFYVWAFTDWGFGAYRTSLMLAGVVGTSAAVSAGFFGSLAVRQIVLCGAAALLTLAWFYFQFGVSEAGAFTCGFPIPFLGFVAAIVWHVRKCWGMW